MKRFFLLTCALLLVVCLFQTGTPTKAQAKSISHLDIAPNSWSSGEEVTVDLEKYPIPDYFQLLGKAVKISELGIVCHDFRGGQYYWVPQVRQLKEGVWVKIESTAGWYPNEEGKYQVCANIKQVGTYALFGFFDPPEGWLPRRPDLPV
jgi:hypothetical protein